MKHLTHTIAYAFLILVILVQAIMLHSFLKYIPLEKAMDKIKMHAYSRDYTCLNYSNDLVAELSKEGIQAETVVGTTNNPYFIGTKHEWVAVYFEPQTGNFTSNYIKD